MRLRFLAGWLSCKIRSLLTSGSVLLKYSIFARLHLWLWWISMVWIRVISSPHYSSTTILTFIASFVNLSYWLIPPLFYWGICRRTSYGSAERRWCPSPHLASLLCKSRCERNSSAAKIFTSTYDNFIQTARIRDGASTAPSFSRFFFDTLDSDSDVTRPEVIRLTSLMPLMLYVTLSHLMFSVGMLPVTMLVAPTEGS